MNGKHRYLGVSFSELAGHASFVCVTAAFLNTDMMVLRALAMSGVTLSIIFQFYRPMPLWIPIRWNFLLLAINGAMCFILINERHQANSMPCEMEIIFREANFEKRGFSRVEFNKLFRMGKKVKYKCGEFLTQAGRENTRL